MARFTILGQYLYTVTYSEMIVFDITTISDPNEVNRLSIGWDIETIFPRGENLFLGSMTGLHIYSVANPTTPEWLSTVQHVRACDPVTAQGNFAYVTLRNSMDTPCGPFWNNQLDVLDISNPSAPRLLNSFSMYNPHGVGIDGDVLFIADGDQGLKVFDASVPAVVGNKELAHFPDMNGYDVIAIDGILTFVGKDGIAQYSYDDPRNIELLSTIPVITE